MLPISVVLDISIQRTSYGFVLIELESDPDSYSSCLLNDDASLQLRRRQPTQYLLSWDDSLLLWTDWFSYVGSHIVLWFHGRLRLMRHERLGVPLDA